MAHDVNVLRQVGVRLQARLASTPPGTLSDGAEQVIHQGLTGLLPVLEAVATSVRRKLGIEVAEEVN
jgi:hypothetical protein